MAKCGYIHLINLISILKTKNIEFILLLKLYSLVLIESDNKPITFLLTLNKIYMTPEEKQAIKKAKSNYKNTKLINSSKQLKTEFLSTILNYQTNLPEFGSLNVKIS